MYLRLSGIGKGFDARRGVGGGNAAEGYCTASGAAGWMRVLRRQAGGGSAAAGPSAGGRKRKQNWRMYGGTRADGRGACACPSKELCASSEVLNTRSSPSRARKRETASSVRHK
eukprot:1208751-Pleurochrysis_carterae.AAC.4